MSDYLPFGATLNDVNNSSSGYENSYKFTGQELDEETGLYYYGARYYDPGLGRFLAVDELQKVLAKPGELKKMSGKKLEQILADPQSLNSYTYVLNNPLKYVDDNGEFAGLLTLGAIAIVGLLITPDVANAPAPGIQPQDSMSQTQRYATIGALTAGVYGTAKICEAINEGTENLSTFQQSTEGRLLIQLQKTVIILLQGMRLKE